MKLCLTLGCVVTLCLCAAVVAADEQADQQRIGIKRDVEPVGIERLSDTQVVLLAAGQKFCVVDLKSGVELIGPEALSRSVDDKKSMTVLPLQDGDYLLLTGERGDPGKAYFLNADKPDQLQLISEKAVHADASGRSVIVIEATDPGSKAHTLYYWDDYLGVQPRVPFMIELNSDGMPLVLTAGEVGPFRADSTNMDGNRPKRVRREFQVLELTTGNMNPLNESPLDKILKSKSHSPYAIDDNLFGRFANTPYAHYSSNLFDLEKQEKIGSLPKLQHKPERVVGLDFHGKSGSYLYKDKDEFTNGLYHLYIYQAQDDGPGLPPLQIRTARKILDACFLDAETIIALHPHYELRTYKLPRPPAFSAKPSERQPLEIKIDPKAIDPAMKFRTNQWTWTPHQQTLIQDAINEVKLHNGFFELDSERFFVRTDVSPQFTSEVMLYLHLFETSIRPERLFGVDESDVKTELTMFRNPRSNYRKRLKQGTMGFARWEYGVDDIREMEITIFIPDPEVTSFTQYDRSLLNYELLIAMFQKSVGRHAIQNWLMAGCAMYYEHWDPRESSAAFHKWNREANPAAKALAEAMHQRNQTPRLKDLLQLRSYNRVANNRTSQQVYQANATAYAFFDFLMNDKNSGESLKVILERIEADRGTLLTRREVEQLESRWHQWLKKEYLERFKP